MTIYLDRYAVLAAGAAACGFVPVVGDEGLLEAAITRPRASAFGIDAYPSVWDKAAALMHSLANNHALLDGNKRTAWASGWLMLALNDEADFATPRSLDVDAAEAFILSLSANEMDWRTASEELQRFAP